MSADVQIITDSTTDIPPDLAQRLGITVIPCLVRFGEKFYRDGVDLTREAFYALLRKGPVATSQPPIGVFEQVYHQAAERGREIISIHAAGRLSGIYNAACAAARNLPQAIVEVIDSRSASLGAGLLAVAAAEAAQRGESLATIAAQVQEMAGRVRVLAVLDTLDYIRRGGRVAWALAMIGSLLSIKPLVMLKEGQVDLLERPRTLSAALRRLVERVRELGPLEQMWVLHTQAPEAAARLADMLAALFPRERMVIAEAGVTIAAHAGPGAVGVACLVTNP
ncbi:MAG: DegV family protein [Anaerolineae bacterium]|nr:DegV family protein [Anaerolineae bacterium]